MSFLGAHPALPPLPPPAPDDVPKKRTRRRLRVSCVECTRRRQKCDRQQPCGLCKTRGVEHLCRWETEPFARPPPARPPGRAGVKKEKSTNLITPTPISNASSSAVVSLRSTPASTSLIPGWQSAVTSAMSIVQSDPFPRTSPSPAFEYPSRGLKEAALALARMQLTEEDYHLCEGSLACALQELTDSMKARNSELLLTGHPQASLSMRPSGPWVPRLPDKGHCNKLLREFHEHVNWSIGIPYNVLFSVHESMWMQMHADPMSLGRLSPSWLSLLFAIFAFSPGCETEEESRDYFYQALAARKLQEERSASLDAPSSSSDTRSAVYSCLATAFLARYLQDRGRITEAWKVIGGGLRDAQNAGLHRCLAPGKSKHLTNDERTFMLVAWHLCVEFDRYLSLFLGRPTVIRSRDCNVQLPSTRCDVLAPDGSTNTALLFQYYFISMTRIVSDAKEKFLSVNPDPEDGHAHFDGKMNDWLSSLPSYFRWDAYMDKSYDVFYPKLYLQRLTLRAYYSCSCLLYHRALAYTRPAEDVAAAYSATHSWDRSQLAQYAINVLRTQVALLCQQWWERQVPFDISMYMFEASVTLGVTLLRDLHHPHADEWRRELAAAIGVFENLQGRDNGKIVAQALQVLRVLLELCSDSKTKVIHESEQVVQTEDEAKMFFPMEGYDTNGMIAPQANSVNVCGDAWFPAQGVNDTVPLNGYVVEGEAIYMNNVFPTWMPDGMTMPNVIGPDSGYQYT